MGRAFFIALSAFSRMKRGRGGAGCRFVVIRFLPYFNAKISPKTSPFFYSDKPQNFWGLFSNLTNNAIEVFRQYSQVVRFLRSDRMPHPACDDVRRDPVANPVVFATCAQVLEELRPAVETSVEQYPPKTGIEALAPVFVNEEGFGGWKFVELLREFAKKDRRDRDDSIGVIFAVSLRFGRMNHEPSSSQIDGLTSKRKRFLLSQACMTPQTI